MMRAMSRKVLRKMKSSVPREIRLLPVELPLLVAVGEREEGEVHRAHVERAHLRLGHQRRLQAILDRHVEAAAGGDVDDRVGRLLDARQELHEHLGIGRRPAGLRIARMEMEDRRTGLRRLDRLARDVLRPVGQRVRHGRRMDGAGDGAADDDLVLFRRHSRQSSDRLPRHTPKPGQAGGSVTIFCRWAATRRRSSACSSRVHLRKPSPVLKPRRPLATSSTEVGQRSRRPVEIGQHVLVDIERQVGADEIGVLERPDDGQPSAEPRP